MGFTKEDYTEILGCLETRMSDLQQKVAENNLVDGMPMKYYVVRIQHQAKLIQKIYVLRDKKPTLFRIVSSEGITVENNLYMNQAKEICYQMNKEGKGHYVIKSEIEKESVVVAEKEEEGWIFGKDEKNNCWVGNRNG